MEIPTSDRKNVIDILVTVSFFCDKTSQSNVNNFFLLEVGSSMITLSKALIWL